jgi:ubiquinol-cytochrome c reductase cytochrome b subunit
MVGLHILLLPVVLGVIVLAHVLLVRKHGIVPPLQAIDNETTGAEVSS